MATLSEKVMALDGFLKGIDLAEPDPVFTVETIESKAFQKGFDIGRKASIVQ